MVSCDGGEQKNRLARRSAGGHSVSDGRIDLLDLQKANFDYPSEMEGKIIEISSMHAPDHLTNFIYKELNRS